MSSSNLREQLARRMAPARRQRASLGTRAHRPWPLPERRWLVGQTWRALSFLHWPVAADELRRVVPDALPLDLFEGQSWLGITPFEVVGHRLNGTPPPPVVSRFEELNVRTYVTLDGRPGIHFFSLDAASLSAVAAARTAFRLPYFPARMRIAAAPDAVEYASVRLAGPQAALNMRYGVTGEPFTAAAGSFEHWLTERYCLYTVGHRGPPRRTEIHHPPWPLQHGAAEVVTNTMAEPLGLRLQGEPHVLVASRQDVVIWPPVPIA